MIFSRQFGRGRLFEGGRLFEAGRLFEEIRYSSTSNIGEVMKFYNLGHKTFGTDFNNLFQN